MASNRQFKHPIQLPAVDADKDIIAISTEDLLKAVKPSSGVVQVKWRGLDLFIRRYISLNETIRLVDGILNRCYDGEVLQRELMDFELRLAIVIFYSNVSMPEDPESCAELLYCTDLYDTIRGYIQEGQICAIEEALKSYFNK